MPLDKAELFDRMYALVRRLAAEGGWDGMHAEAAAMIAEAKDDSDEIGRPFGPKLG